MSVYDERLEARRQAELNYQNTWNIFCDKEDISDSKINTLFSEETRVARDQLLGALDPQNLNQRKLRISWFEDLQTELDSMCANPAYSKEYSIYGPRAFAVGRARKYLSPDTIPSGLFSNFF